MKLLFKAAADLPGTTHFSFMKKLEPMHGFRMCTRTWISKVSRAVGSSVSLHLLAVVALCMQYAGHSFCTGIVFGTHRVFLFPRLCKGSMNQCLDCRVVQANVLQERQNNVSSLDMIFLMKFQNMRPYSMASSLDCICCCLRDSRNEKITLLYVNAARKGCEDCSPGLCVATFFR